MTESGSTADRLRADIARGTNELLDKLRRSVWTAIENARTDRTAQFSVKIPDGMGVGEERLVIEEFSSPQHGFRITKKGDKLFFSV